MTTKTGATEPSRRRSRRPIPVDVQRKVLVECGHKCSIPQCQVKRGLEFHHTDHNPRNNREENILVLCQKHHRMAHGRGAKLTRDKCEQLKKTIAQFGIPLVADKRTLKQTWRKVQAGRGALAWRRGLLESLAENLLVSVPGLIVGVKIAHRPTGEVDILLRNETADTFLDKLGPRIVAECEARKSSPVQDTEVADFLRKMALNGWRTGLFFSASGFTDDAVRVAATPSGKHFLVVLIGPDEIGEMIRSDDRLEPLKQAVQRSLAGG